MTRALQIIVCAGVGALAGCTAVPHEAAQPMVLHGVDRTQAMHAGQEVLYRMQFSISRVDPQSGRIQTHPLPGAQAFEFWRRDAVGLFNLAESTFQSIRRTADLTFAPVDDGTSVTCTVTTERLSLPSREIAGSSQGYQILTDSTESLQTLKLSPDQESQMAWIPLGTDPALAEAILDQIRKEATGKRAQQTTEASPETRP